MHHGLLGHEVDEGELLVCNTHKKRYLTKTRTTDTVAARSELRHMRLVHGNLSNHVAVNVLDRVAQAELELAVHLDQVDVSVSARDDHHVVGDPMDVANVLWERNAV